MSSASCQQLFYFFLFRCFPQLLMPRSTAILDYHICRFLSTTFLIYFVVHCLHLFAPMLFSSGNFDRISYGIVIVNIIFSKDEYFKGPLKDRDFRPCPLYIDISCEVCTYASSITSPHMHAIIIQPHFINKDPLQNFSDMII